MSSESNFPVKAIAVGCGTVALLFLGCIIGIGVWLATELPVLDATLEVASIVELDSEFDLVINLSNPHDQAVTLDSIDIHDEFLTGFQVVDVQPAPNDTMTIFGMRSWDFGTSVAAGASTSVTLKLRAVEVGHFIGDIDVCNPNQDFNTLIADVVVREKEE